MAESFTGEIRMFAGNYAPYQWAYCDGQLMDPAQNQALFSLLGATYGGDGRTSFALPDMRGRLPLHFGTGPGLTPRQIGAAFGTERVALTDAQMPAHSHQLVASSATDNASAAPNSRLTSGSQVSYDNSINATLAEQAVSNTGAGTMHSNLMPFLAVHFIMSLAGIYPPRD